MYKGFEFKSGLDTFVQKLLAVSGKNSFNVIFKGQGAATNCYSDIYLPEVRDDAVLSRAKLQRYTGYILHEWSHIQYTQSVSIDNRHPNPVYLKQIWNALEDGWIEGKTIDSGVVPNASILFTALVNGIYREAFAANIDWHDPRQWPFALAVWSRKYITLRPPVPVEVAAIFDRAVIRPASNSEDNLNIARDVYTQLRKFLKDNPQPQPPNDSESDDESDGEPDDESDGESRGESSGDSGDDESDGESGGDSRSPCGDLDAVNDPTAVEPTPEENIESTDERKRREELTPPWELGEGIGGQEVHPPRATGKNLYFPVSTPARLRYELNRLFDGSAREQYNNGQRAGQVNVGSLHRYSFDDSVFRRRQEEEGIDTALYILIDVSGSTSKRLCGAGAPTIYESEFAATHSIIDALRGASVQIAVDAFADGIAQVGDWGINVGKFKSNHANAYNKAGGGTNDYAAVLHAHHRLLQRPEKRKVLLVFSDGLGHAEKVQHQCEIGSNLGITTIGIGIGVNVSGVYPQSVYVKDVSQLASVSLRQIQLAA